MSHRAASDLGPTTSSSPAAGGGLPNGWRAFETLWIPLVSDERLVGCLSVDDPQNGRSPSLETVRALEIFANQAVTAIEIAHRSYTDAREQSIRDGLTGAYNHRHFQEAAPEARSAERSRQARPVTILMLDIDDFKSVNDRWGHPVGDAILQRIDGEIRGEVRGDMDIVARYGGEEFAVILPETPATRRRGGRAHPSARRRAPVPGRPTASDIIRVTVSIGLATYPTDDGREKELIERADSALYRAKRGGKNQVAVYAPAARHRPRRCPVDQSPQAARSRTPRPLRERAGGGAAAEKKRPRRLFSPHPFASPGGVGPETLKPNRARRIAAAMSPLPPRNRRRSAARSPMRGRRPRGGARSRNGPDRKRSSPLIGRRDSQAPAELARAGEKAWRRRFRPLGGPQQHGLRALRPRVTTLAQWCIP